MTDLELYRLIKDVQGIESFRILTIKPEVLQLYIKILPESGDYVSVRNSIAQIVESSVPMGIAIETHFQSWVRSAGAVIYGKYKTNRFELIMEEDNG